MTDIDPYPISGLFVRYGKSRDVVYKRLDALNITPHKLEKGNQSYITLEELWRMDALHEHVKGGGKVAEFVSEQLSSNVLPDEQPNSIVRQLPGLNVEQFLELAQAIALMLRPSDRYSNYETLERFAKNRWLIQSGQLSGLIGKQPKGSLIQWGGFVMQRQGRWWSVKKRGKSD